MNGPLTFQVAEKIPVELLQKRQRYIFLYVFGNRLIYICISTFSFRTKMLLTSTRLLVIHVVLLFQITGLFQCNKKLNNTQQLRSTFFLIDAFTKTLIKSNRLKTRGKNTCRGYFLKRQATKSKTPILSSTWHR